MATPAAHARMACPDQAKTPDGSGDPESSLKNGTTFEDSEDSGGSSTNNMVVKSRGSGQHSSGREPSSMEHFQDGGGSVPQPHSRPGSGVDIGYPVDRPRMNSDFQSYNQSGTRDSNPMVNDDFRGGGGGGGSSAPDGYNHGCELGYPRGGYIGEIGNTSGDIATNSQPNKMYPQYNQAQMRPGYGQSPRNMAMGPQQRSPGPTVGRYPAASSQQQQRFLLGPSIAQQTGPTPTLNQLLQAPNSLQRYHNSYEYASNQGLHKNMGEPGPQYPGPNNSWGGMRASGYQAQQMGSSIYRSQGWPGTTYESWLKQPKIEPKSKKVSPGLADPSMKRPYGGGGGQISSPTPGPSPQGPPPQQYPPQQGGGPMPEAPMKRPYGGPPGSNSQMPATPSAGPSSQGSQQYTQQAYHQYGQQAQGTAVRPAMGQNYPQQGMQQYSNVQQPAGPQPTPTQGPGGPVYDHQRQPQQQQPMPQYGSHIQQQQQQQQPLQQTPMSQPQQQQQQPPPQHQQQQQPSTPHQQMPQTQMPPVQPTQQQQQPSPATQQQQQQQPQQQPQPAQQQQSQQQAMSQQQQQPQSQVQQQQQQQPQQPQHMQTPVQDASGNGNGSSAPSAAPGGGGAGGSSSGGNSNSSSSGGGGGAGDETPTGNPSPSAGSGGSSTPGLRTPTTPPHPVVSPHRPVPSPSGGPASVGSPSVSSSLGQQQQQNIPMPPRPSSSQSETSGQSPMSQPPPVGTAQGYNQQMAPPSMYGNKMHQGMMGGSGSPVAPYSSHQPSGHYAQGTYHRSPNSMTVQGYGGSQSQGPYPGPVSGPNYPAQSTMPTHRMPTHAGAGPPNYSSPSSYPNAQYGSSGPPPPASGYGMSNMMPPPPNQYQKANAMPPPTGGAQAAAQAAVMAAAASSGSMRQSPMYLRQHLQQKMYPGGYGGSSMSPVPPGAPGSNAPMGSESTPMPPPSSTPSSSQPLCMSQASPMPPQSSTPGAIAGGSSCDSSMQSSSAPTGFTQTSAPSLGPPQTTITQSISSPVPSAVTVSSPSLMGSDMVQSQQQPQGRVPVSVPQGPPPPPIIDEGSQASNASASSSLPEERVETPKPNSKPTMSHPPTPNTLSSPGAASMSSFHDEFESVSSPSWPRTPASPVVNNQTYDHHPIKRPDGMLKLYDMSDDPDRRMFLDKLIMYNEERGTPISQCPTISKQPLDLYRLYMACKERGGFAEVMKAKLWKDIAGLIGIGASSSAAYTLRKQYIKHLLPFECKYDRGGIDPGPLINSFESNSRKKNAAKNAMMNQEAYHQGGPMMDGYSSPYPGAYPPSSGPHPGMMPNADYPGHHPPYSDAMHPGGSMVNHSGSEGAVDPFSDDMPASQYPQRHSSGDGYGYSQPSTNSGIPPYSGNQSSMAPSGQYGPYSSGSVSQQEPYGDQYSNSMGPPSSESSYGNRAMVSDPYAPPGGYPPNRTVGPTNPPSYPPYQGPCDQERYDQPGTQGPMLRPQSAGAMGGTPQDSAGYPPPPPHRYPSPSMASRENMPAQQMGSYQGRPPMSQSQYQGPSSQTSSQPTYPQPQQDSYRSATDYPPQMSRLQSTLIQRLQPKNHSTQNYPSNQQGMYGQTMAPPNKVAPQSTIPGNMYQRDMYSMGPKRHGDYSKPHGPGQDQYHMGSYPQQQTQGPYADRNQYPYRPTHGMPTASGPQPGWTRDGRPYSTGPNQYQGGHRDGWDVSRHGDGAPPGSGNWPRYSGPQQDPYSSHMGPGSMGPKMGLNRGYMSPNKMPPHPGVGPPSQYGPPSTRKEIIFPPDSVEAVTPVMSKRRRLLAKDIVPVDPWRIMMALKSGLLCESTWALDVLSILVCDDSTVLYFGLSHMPGLLEVLMDHYRCCLNLIYDLLGDLEVGFIAGDGLFGKKMTQRSGQKWYELDKDVCPPEEVADHTSEVLSGDKVPVLNSPNYTQRTRCRKCVKTQVEEALFLFDPYKKWDLFEGFISGSSHWQHGGGESTVYIQTHFENDETNVRFVRIMEEVRKQREDEQHDKGEKVDQASDQGRCPKDETVPSEDGQCLKRECGSDTEEDENSCVSMPSPSNSSSLRRTEESGVKDDELASKDDASRDDAPCEAAVDATKSEADGGSSKADDDAARNSPDGSTSAHPESKDEKSESADVFPKVRPSPNGRKRKTMEEMEDEAYNRDEPSLCITTDAQDSLARRCICISTLLRNLSFVPGNDTEMSKHAGFLMVMGRLLLLNHVHSPRKPPQRHYDREEDSESTSVGDSCSSLNCDQEWWWDMLHLLRENTLVTLANIAGQLDLAPFPEEISFPLLDGLMHWVTCPSSYAQDPLPTQPSQSVLSPQRLSLEALCKLSVLESNVDLMMATPPWQRIDRFFSLLAKWLSRNEDQVLREFSVVLLSNLSQADSSMARAIALQGTCIPLLITFVEQAEQSALQVANSQGINALRENPELMGTTLDMVRRAAGTLRCLARVPNNRTLFLQHQQRLLALVMSQILDQGVASIIADVLFECSQELTDESLCSSSAVEDRASAPPSPVIAAS